MSSCYQRQTVLILSPIDSSILNIVLSAVIIHAITIIICCVTNLQVEIIMMIYDINEFMLMDYMV